MWLSLNFEVFRAEADFASDCTVHSIRVVSLVQSRHRKASCDCTFDLLPEPRHPTGDRAQEARP